MSDIIIIGAGAAGLMAARQLGREGKQVFLIEARERIGGRIHTFHPPDFALPLELGAEFVHGDLTETMRCLDEYGIPYAQQEGQAWQVRDEGLEKDKEMIDQHRGKLRKELDALKQDMSIEQFLDTHFAGREYAELRQEVRRFVQGYDAADPARCSTFSFRDEWSDVEKWEQYRIEGGYERLVHALQEESAQLGSILHLDTMVKTIRWKKGEVTAITQDERKFQAPKLLLTVPLGVWQAACGSKSELCFEPALPEKTAAAAQLGYGCVIKIHLQFSEAFWKNEDVKDRLGRKLDDLGFIFSEEAVPTWWTQGPDAPPLLCGWLSGPPAQALSGAHDLLFLDLALTSLTAIFKENKSALRDRLQAWKISDWGADPFARGAYSYATVNADQHIETLRKNVEETLFFAGEALDNEAGTGTVEAALRSGRKTAEEILATYKVKSEAR